jgi:hypothetical protein
MRFTYRAAGPITAAVILTLLSGCSRTQQDWRAAQQADTPQAYQDAARIRMESRSLAQAPQGAAWIPAGAAAPLAHGSAASSPPAQAGAAAQTNSAIQLGAFSSGANAQREWRQLSLEFRSQLGGLTPAIVPVTVSGRRLYRLEARIASQSAARRLCRQLQQHSQGCLPLP